MVDVKKFWVCVHTTGVKKGWDWVELPDGRRISVPEGKYVKVMTIGNKTAIGFEDLTEEIGEKPDWDFSTPLCVVDEEVGGVQKTAKLRCEFTGRYHVSLFYEGSKVAEFWWGKTFDAPSLSYVDVQALAQQLPIAPPVMPVFDYIIDIYSDKVVIASGDGTTTTLSSVADLNNWLKNVRDKRIRINAHVVVTSDLALTRNEYWVFGEWINTNVYVTEPNITIVSFAPLGNDWGGYYVCNMSPDTGNWVDVSGLKLFAVYADVDIESPGSLPPPTYMPVTIAVLSTTSSVLMGTRGDVVVKGFYLKMDFCMLGNTFIDVDELWSKNCVADNSLVVLISRRYTRLNNVNLDNALGFLCDMRFLMYDVDVPAGGSASISLPLPRKNEYYDLYIEQVGVANEDSAPDGSYILYYLTPLPSGVTYSVDAPNKRIVITNSTSNSVTVTVIFRILILM